jgi:hypothetical protein
MNAPPRGEGDRQRADPEQRQRAKEDLLAAVAVAEQPGWQQRRGQDQGVAGDEPLQVRGGGVQVGGQLSDCSRTVRM